MTKTQALELAVAALKKEGSRLAKTYSMENFSRDEGGQLVDCTQGWLDENCQAIKLIQGMITEVQE
jgi:hypothetical protein